jgi:adenylate cyclase
MEFRIGINLGDVIEEGERIYGDGVNVAARVEGLAEGGGICISRTAFDQVKNKLNVGYENLGEHSVKNIAEPVRVYRVLMEPEIAGKVIGEEKLKWTQWRWATIGVVVALLLIAGALAIWKFYFRPPFEPASEDKMAYQLPDKPSIAVLPFMNMSEDPNQEYLADGITENIISALSQVPMLFVIARNSTYTYKGKPVKVQKVAEDLGVQYVLEGSVQRSGDSLRITVQFIDALSGHHLWSERYDRELENIFALQDEITIEIITALQVKLTTGEEARLTAKGTDDLQAYLKYLQARESFFTQTREGNAQARRLVEEVIEQDPEFPGAYLLLGATHWMDVIYGSSKSPEESLKRAFELTKKAIALDDSDATAHSLLGWLYVFMKREYEEAIAECEQAVSLAPSSAMANIWMSGVLTFAGRHEEAVRYAEQALRLNPFPEGWYFRFLGYTYFGAGRNEEAIAAYKKALDRAPNDIMAHLALTTAYSWAGRLEEARAQAAEVLRINPKFSIKQRAKTLPYKNQTDQGRYLDGLRKAGLPETPPLPLPNKPSIAVLPFVNMSGDPEQEYFSDGITEEIITALSKVPDLFVIARNSSFTYKGKSVLIPTVGRELGVQYVLEGSVRKSGDKVRITAQLIDAKTNKHLWAERYDRDLKDIFALQDEITIKILTAVRVKLTDGEQARLYGKRAKNLDSFMKVLEGRPYFYRFNRESNVQARQMFEEAIALEPENAHAFTMLGWTYLMEEWFGSSESSSKAVDRAVELAQKALSLDDTIDLPHSLLAHVYLMKRQFEMAIAEAERAVALNPNGADAQAHLGIILNYVGRREGAIASLEKAIRLNPIPPNWYAFSLGEAYCLAGQHEKALAAYEQVLHRYPDDIRALIGSAATHSLLGREEEARAQAAQILKMEPKFNLESFVKTLPFKNKADAELLIDSLYKAGLK